MPVVRTLRAHSPHTHNRSPHTHNRSPHTPCAVGGAKAEPPGYSVGRGRTRSVVARTCGVSTVGHMRSIWTTGHVRVPTAQPPLAAGYLTRG